VRNSVLLITDTFDRGGQLLARRLGNSVVTVTPRDLSRVGWTYHPKPERRTGSTVDGAFRACDLRAVVTRLVGVYPGHLPHVSVPAREYIAAEMTAFLRAWLTALPCPVHDPPTSLSLSGHVWSPEQWAVLAARHDIPLAPTWRTVPADVQSPDAGAARLVVAGSRHLAQGSVPGLLVDATHRLAAVAGQHCLETRVVWVNGSPRLSRVNAWPDLTEPAVLDLFVASIDASIAEVSP
jgi:hypothetical protein